MLMMHLIGLLVNINFIIMNTIKDYIEVIKRYVFANKIAFIAISISIAILVNIIISTIQYLTRDKTKELQQEQIDIATLRISVIKTEYENYEAIEQDAKNMKIELNKEQKFFENCLTANTGSIVMKCEYKNEEFKIAPEVNAETWSITINKKTGNKPLSQAELFYTTAVRDGCHVSQTEESHYLKKNGGVLATDVACRFGQDKAQRAMVYVPDYIWEAREYVVLKVWEDKLLWNYIELWFDTLGWYEWKLEDSMYLHNAKWIIAHIETKHNEGDIVKTWEVLGQMNISWATTGYHTHIELWKMIDWQWTNVSYSTRSQAVDNRRNGKLDTTVKKGDPIYSTQYNLGDVNQNDASPYIGASGNDLRNVTNPIALTADIRNLYGLKFGDKVNLKWPCSWVYQVEDEMNSRYRTSCIQKEGGCIKMDIAIKQGEKKNCSGVYTIMN